MANYKFLNFLSSKNIQWLSFFMALMALLLSVYQTLTRPQIAFVRSQELVYGYSGMQDMHNKYELETKVWQSNLDTLKKEYETAVKQYQAEAKYLSDREKAKREQLLIQKQEDITSYSTKIESEAHKKEGEMLQGVLNQINTVVADYGKAHGYDIIVGTTEDGNLLYGNDALDITKDLSNVLNQNYKK
ncbi:MAG: OmpH family outer membrane protein [Chitinophagales bacterium]|nr:OmpH family outer membrane protein [Chitinophagales bacterium]